jgi:hypothetical protein
MVNNLRRKQTVDEVKRKLASLRTSVAELESVVHLMESSGVSEIETTNVGQMDRAIGYCLSYATGARRAVISASNDK